MRIGLEATVQEHTMDAIASEQLDIQVAHPETWVARDSTVLDSSVVRDQIACERSRFAPGADPRVPADPRRARGRSALGRLQAEPD
ncbi:hypothetical protein [Amycolatopsis sp. NPDC050768]|uniref:hypothetical protein n=1 Tax=Amycolatopsis sp. NPDC050768 TaxID=3154839 RepID=UPI0033FF0F7C